MQLWDVLRNETGTRLGYRSLASLLKLLGRLRASASSLSATSRSFSFTVKIQFLKHCKIAHVEISQYLYSVEVRDDDPLSLRDETNFGKLRIPPHLVDMHIQGEVPSRPV